MVGRIVCPAIAASRPGGWQSLEGPDLGCIVRVAVNFDVLVNAKSLGC